MATKTYTKEEIQTLVSTKPAWAEHALLALLERQTEDEQRSQATKHQNGAGFNGTDAAILTSFAQQVQRGRKLSEKQLAIAYKKLPKYAGQLLAIASERQTVTA